MENVEGKLQTKPSQLEIHAKRMEQVLDSGCIEAIERHKGALTSTISKADELERALEALRPVYKGDICRGNSMQFVSRLSCSFKIARINQVRISVHMRVAISQGFPTCLKAYAT